MEDKAYIQMVEDDLFWCGLRLIFFNDDEIMMQAVVKNPDFGNQVVSIKTFKVRLGWIFFSLSLPPYFTD